ncbi:MAG: hypothetical protein C0621_05365 [Desulfuromonas sp.]|nr:MAG: hypothetical protein C0621_05365 [Desulfuromonas sp.]
MSVDFLDDGSFSEYLFQLIDMGRIEPHLIRLARQVIDQGIESLDASQRETFQTEVLDVFTTPNCSQCGAKIPWAEMAETIDQDGICGWCIHLRSRGLTSPPISARKG